MQILSNLSYFDNFNLGGNPLAGAPPFIRGLAGSFVIDNIQNPSKDFEVEAFFEHHIDNQKPDIARSRTQYLLDYVREYVDYYTRNPNGTSISRKYKLEVDVLTRAKALFAEIQVLGKSKGYIPAIALAIGAALFAGFQVGKGEQSMS